MELQNQLAQLTRTVSKLEKWMNENLARKKTASNKGTIFSRLTPNSHRCLQVGNYSDYARLVLREAGYRDVKILCSDGERLAHRLTIASISPFMAQTFNDQLPGEMTYVSLPDVSLAILDPMLELAYSGICTVPQNLEAELKSTMDMLGWVPMSALEKIPLNTSSPTSGRAQNNAAEAVSGQLVSSEGTPVSTSIRQPGSNDDDNTRRRTTPKSSNADKVEQSGRADMNIKSKVQAVPGEHLLLSSGTPSRSLAPAKSRSGFEIVNLDDDEPSKVRGPSPGHSVVEEQGDKNIGSPPNKNMEKKEGMVPGYQKIVEKIPDPIMEYVMAFNMSSREPAIHEDARSVEGEAEVILIAGSDGEAQRRQPDFTPLTPGDSNVSSDDEKDSGSDNVDISPPARIRIRTDILDEEELRRRGSDDAADPSLPLAYFDSPSSSVEERATTSTSSTESSSSPENPEKDPRPIPNFVDPVPGSDLISTANTSSPEPVPVPSDDSADGNHTKSSSVNNEVTDHLYCTPHEHDPLGLLRRRPGPACYRSGQLAQKRSLARSAEGPGGSDGNGLDSSASDSESKPEVGPPKKRIKMPDSIYNSGSMETRSTSGSSHRTENPPDSSSGSD